ncbi:MAG: hypothetical protein JWO53_1101 [Chlamydiia bacterium]|nr:hypothetical protein [Chlamydiia bacterium]
MYFIKKNWVYFLLTITWYICPAPILAGENKPFTTTHYYFAYGSNLSYDFLKERLKDGSWIDGWHRGGQLPDPLPIDMGSFELSDYEFRYSLNVEPFEDIGTAGNVKPKRGAKVYGAVYKISEKQLAELDKSEDVPEAYARIAVKVHRIAKPILNKSSSPSILTVWVYVGNPKYVIEEENPDPEYTGLIIRSAYERAFPIHYIENHLTIKSTLPAL